MRRFLKYFYHKTTIGHLLLSPIKYLYDIYHRHILPEKLYIKRTFKNVLGYNLNLKNPKTFNEKIQWLQLNNRKLLHTLCTDKYIVRNYVKDKIGEQYLVPLILQTYNPAEIIPENLPDFPCIIKTNHDCGGHIIVKDKFKVNWKNVQNILKKSLKDNFYYRSREWQYKNIEPCIIVEKLLLDNQLNAPFEYRYFCANGKVAFSVILDRHANSKIKFYDPNWNIIPYGIQNDIIDRPKNLSILKKMQSLAEVLAKDFSFVRVDLYNVRRDIYFSELTFSPSAGYEVFDPPKWDRIFGDKLIL